MKHENRNSNDTRYPTFAFVFQTLTWDKREISAAFLAAGWVLPASLMAALLERPLDAHSTLSLLLVRALLFGLIPVLVCPSLPLKFLFPPTLALDLILLRAFVGTLSIAQLIVELALFAFIFIPAQLFARWTIAQRRLIVRAILHPIFHAGLLLGVLPALFVLLGLGSWTAPLHRTPWMNKIYAQLVLIPAVILISAVQEFALRGRGTPMPADAPRRLVRSGIYAYVANPMQIGKLAMLSAWGVFWGNYWLLSVVLIGLLYSLFVASPREDRAMAVHFPSEWTEYRRHVRRWWPQWRPYHPSLDAFPLHPTSPARLYLDLTCGPCAQLASWLRDREPIGLQIAPIANSPSTFPQITYDPGDGSALEFGIAALARTLEHTHITFAFCAWMVRLPIIALLTQAIADALDPRAPQCPLPQTSEAHR